MVLSRRQAIIWANDGLVYRRVVLMVVKVMVVAVAVAVALEEVETVHVVVELEVVTVVLVVTEVVLIVVALVIVILVTAIAYVDGLVQYLQYVSNGDSAVLHKVIDMCQPTNPSLVRILVTRLFGLVPGHNLKRKRIV